MIFTDEVCSLRITHIDTVSQLVAKLLLWAEKQVMLSSERLEGGLAGSHVMAHLLISFSLLH